MGRFVQVNVVTQNLSKVSPKEEIEVFTPQEKL